jgi:hypothetical protein
MRNLIGIILVVVVVIAVLIFSGFLNLSPEGETALDNAQESVGEAVENTGQAIRNADEGGSEAQ